VALAAEMAIDLSVFVLPVLLPTDEEMAAHEAVLADLDKASGQKTIWRQAALA
jgi:DNA polymerase III subunit epsilon